MSLILADFAMSTAVNFSIFDAGYSITFNYNYF
jgi:hypothetical protein